MRIPDLPRCEMTVVSGYPFTEVKADFKMSSGTNESVVYYHTIHLDVKIAII